MDSLSISGYYGSYTTASFRGALLTLDRPKEQQGRVVLAVGTGWRLLQTFLNLVFVLVFLAGRRLDIKDR